MADNQFTIELVQKIRENKEQQTMSNYGKWLTQDGDSCLIINKHILFHDFLLSRLVQTDDDGMKSLISIADRHYQQAMLIVSHGKQIDNLLTKSVEQSDCYQTISDCYARWKVKYRFLHNAYFTVCKVKLQKKQTYRNFAEKQ